MTNMESLGSGLLRALVSGQLISAELAASIQTDAQLKGHSVPRVAVRKLDIDWSAGASAVAQLYNFPLVHLPCLARNATDGLTDQQRAELLTLDVLPLAVRNGRLAVAMADPSDLLRLQQAARVTGLEVHAVTVAADALLNAVNEGVPHTGDALERTEGDTDASSAPSGINDTVGLERFLKKYAMQAIESGADHIHLEAGAQGCRLRIQRDSGYSTLAHLPTAVADLLVQALSQRLQWDLAVSDRLTVRYDIHALDTREGKRLILRRLSDTPTGSDLSSLGFSAEQSAVIQRALGEANLRRVNVHSASRAQLYACMQALARLEDAQTQNIFLLQAQGNALPHGCTGIELQGWADPAHDALVQACLQHEPTRLLIAPFDAALSPASQQLLGQWAQQTGRRLYTGQTTGSTPQPAGHAEVLNIHLSTGVPLHNVELTRHV